MSINNKLHHFSHPVSHISLPEKFTYPFHYSPHILSMMAAKEVQTYLHTRQEWATDLEQGKMFGVLVVQTTTGKIGFLAAFSGILAGKNLHTYFVPPIYDLQQPEGFFRLEEEKISAINVRIKVLSADDNYLNKIQELSEANSLAAQAITKAKEELKEAQRIREKKRHNHPNETEIQAMIHESQFQKAELKRLKQQWDTRITTLQTEVEAFQNKIDLLKTERKSRSSLLQQQLFEQFKILNARGVIRDLCDLFKETPLQTPPAGAGECAAPKLLQYAYLNQLKPIAMAEFWWGNSPKTEIRRHGYFYPACKAKCEPILKHMLLGVDVEENPLSSDLHRNTELEIIFEDEWLLVLNKPAGMLSVPGKMDIDSVYHRIKKRNPDATGPLIVHRLDMATSGLLLIAKNKSVHQNLQAQFKNRTVKKRYIALLEGCIQEKEGQIELPLRADPEDRPRQVADPIYGKPAITRYIVLNTTDNQTRIAFYPITGRTHQLRVHASHPLGLNTPIIGDELYGKKAERLYLHAEQLEFTHPATGEQVSFEKKADF